MLSAVVFLALLSGRAVFRGLGCFDAEPGACVPPPGAFDTLDRRLAGCGLVLVIAVGWWIVGRVRR